jgi:hypothetical protein
MGRVNVEVQKSLSLKHAVICLCDRLNILHLHWGYVGTNLLTNLVQNYVNRQEVIRDAG